MGLRFRKSVTICKGVKLNLGKTGMSVTLGQKGYHKTIHQNGNVTTSMGIPEQEYIGQIQKTYIEIKTQALIVEIQT